MALEANVNTTLDYLHRALAERDRHRLEIQLQEAHFAQMRNAIAAYAALAPLLTPNIVQLIFQRTE